MAVDLKSYGYGSDLKPRTPSGLDELREEDRRVVVKMAEAELREKALHMAIDYHRSIPGDVEATAAKFLAFLKGGADV